MSLSLEDGGNHAPYTLLVGGKHAPLNYWWMVGSISLCIGGWGKHAPLNYWLMVGSMPLLIGGWWEAWVIHLWLMGSMPLGYWLLMKSMILALVVVGRMPFYNVGQCHFGLAMWNFDKELSDRMPISDIA